MNIFKRLQSKRNTGNELGLVGLVTIMGIGLFALSTAFTVGAGAMLEILKNRNATSGNQTFYSAESGMREGLYQYLSTRTEYSNDDFPPLNNIIANSIQVSISDWPYVDVRGSAQSALTNRNVITTISVFPEGFAFDYATYAQYDLTFGGNIDVNGNIFANGIIDFTGNSAEINGDAYSPNTISDTDNINGNAVSGVDYIPPPQIDTSPYQAEAEINGTYFSISDDAENYLNRQTRNAVVFVDVLTKTKIQGSNTVLNGALVTIGDLDLTGGTYTATGNYAALVVRGDLKIAGGTVINGVVHVSGSTSFGGGNNVINGSLISAGGASVTDLTGSATINYDPDVVANWKDLEGLNTESVEEPRVIRWQES